MNNILTDNRDVERKLMKFKVWHITLILFIISIISYTGHYFLKDVDGLQFFGSELFTDLGAVCFTTAVIAFTYEWFIRTENKIEIQHLLEATLKNFTPDISMAIIDTGIAHKLFQSEKIETIIRNAIKVRAGNEELGNDIYDAFLKNIFRFEERWYNYQHMVTLMRINNGNDSIKRNYYQAYVRLSYETILRKSSFRFVCPDNIETYNLLLQDPEYEFRWHFPRSKDFPQITKDAFNVTSIEVDELPLTITEKTGDHGLEWTCDHNILNEKLGKRVTISYTYEVKIEKSGHMLTLNVVCPTKGVTIGIDFADTEIVEMNVVDSFLTTKKSTINYTPRKSPKKIDVISKEWVLPKGGTTFVWALQSELNREIS